LCGGDDGDGRLKERRAEGRWEVEGEKGRREMEL